jgi:hypothetical protein
VNAVTVQVFSEEQVLESGFPKTLTVTPLYNGPARFSAPAGQFEKAAALDRVFDATLNIHTASNLETADSAIISGQPWRVVGQNSSGYYWRLELRRRDKDA